MIKIGLMCVDAICNYRICCPGNYGGPKPLFMRQGALTKALAWKLLVENFRYTLKPERLGDSDFVDGFLQAGEGYCVHFASAMVVLARTQGIPARYVEGFALNLEKIKETINVGWQMEPELTWAELYFEGIGWLTFDPTPNRENDKPPQSTTTPAVTPRHPSPSTDLPFPTPMSDIEATDTPIAPLYSDLTDSFCWRSVSVVSHSCRWAPSAPVETTWINRRYPTRLIVGVLLSIFSVSCCIDVQPAKRTAPPAVNICAFHT